MPLFALSCSCLTLIFDAGILLTLFFAPSATFRPSARCHPRCALDRASVHLHALCCYCCYAVRLLTLLLHARKGLSHALLPSNLSAGRSYLSLAPRFDLLVFASARWCAVLAAGKGVPQAAAAAGPCRCSCCFAERDAGARVFVR